MNATFFHLLSRLKKGCEKKLALVEHQLERAFRYPVMASSILCAAKDSRCWMEIVGRKSRTTWRLCPSSQASPSLRCLCPSHDLHFRFRFGRQHRRNGGAGGPRGGRHFARAQISFSSSLKSCHLHDLSPCGFYFFLLSSLLARSGSQFIHTFLPCLGATFDAGFIKK